MKVTTWLKVSSVALLLTADPQSVWAFGSYVGRIPNGDVMSCANCHTDSFDLTAFGSAFGDIDETWTRALALQDSDGDGLTNGQELGDPQGVWTPGAALPIPGAAVGNPGDPASKPTLTPPAISLINPTNGAVLNAPFTGDITAGTTNLPASITQVEFFAGANSLGTVTNAPFTLSWTNVPAGSYTLTARITDYLGATNTSAPVLVTVGGVVSPLMFTSLLREGTNAVLSWSGGSGTFAVQKSTNLMETNWIEVLRTTTNTITVPLEGTNGFFRILQTVTP